MNIASVKITIDGKDVTSGWTVTATQITFSAGFLSMGKHVVHLELKDNAANAVSLNQKVNMR